MTTASNHANRVINTLFVLLLTLVLLPDRTTATDPVQRLYATMYGDGFSPQRNTAMDTKPKRIYLAPDDHTDYLWSASEAEYEKAFLEMIDYYLDLSDQTDSNPPNFQSRWNCDGSFWMWTYERNRSKDEFDRFIERVRDGHIGVPLQPLSVVLGGAPTEAIIRGLYYPGHVERRYHLRFPLAYAMENATMPLGLVSLWAGCGASYSWQGICRCDTALENAGDREHDVYWWQGLDGSRILMKWNTMWKDNQHLGGYAEARDPSTIVDFVDTDERFITRYPYPVIGAFGKGWDDVKTLTGEFITVAKDKSNPSRNVIVSNEVDFFRDFETTSAKDIPHYTASFGNEWELYCASFAELSARIKRAVEKLRTAEALSVLVCRKNPSFANGREKDRDQAWMNFGLFWEHNMGAVGRNPEIVNERTLWQRRLVTEVERYVDPLFDDAVRELGRMIRKDGSQNRFFVFNALNWPRTGPADFPFDSTEPVHVIDSADGKETPSQIVRLDGQSYLRILAEKVPSVGYKVYEIRSGAGQSFSPVANVNGSRIENEFYAITLAGRGAMTSVVDKRRDNREWVRPVGSLSLNDLGPGEGQITIENDGPVSVTVAARSASPLQHTSRVTFIRGLDGIFIENTIDQNFDQPHTWHFGFNLDDPEVWHEETGAILRAKLLTEGGHYAPRNARYDWLTMNHFADIGDGNAGMTLSNADCFFMKLGDSTPIRLDAGAASISVLAGGQVMPNSSIHNQAGDTTFRQRFALRARGRYDPAAAMRFALDHQNPLATGPVEGGDAYPEREFSLLHVSGENHVLWALKPADDGFDRGIVLRLWNLAQQPATCAVSFPHDPAGKIWRTTHLETPLEEIPFSGNRFRISSATQQIQTFLIDTN